MKIDLATERSVLVELSLEDLSAFDLTYDALDYKNEQTRRAVERIMECVREETGKSFAAERLQIDVLPNRTGGCLMILTDCAARQQTPEPALFQSDSINALIDAARVLKKQNLPAMKSSLLRRGNTFSLLLDPASAQTVRLLSEFADYTRLNRAEIAAVSEYQQTLLAENALEILGGAGTQL